MKTYHAVYSELASKQGKPRVDSSPWQYGFVPVEPRAIASDPKKYMTYWDSRGVTTTMSIMHSLESEPEGYRVFILISRPHR